MWARPRSAPQRILIVNPFGIGDVLFSTPLVSAVRKAFPHSFLGYLCNRRTEPVLKTNPHVDEVFVYEKDDAIRLWRRAPLRGLAYLGQLLSEIRRRRFDLAIDLSLGERYSFLLRLLGVPRRVGFNYKARGRFLSEAFDIEGYHGRHIVDFYWELLAWLGVRGSHERLEFQPSDTDHHWARQWLAAHQLDRHRPRVGIIPAGGVSWGSGAPFRRWGAAGFAAVADALQERFQAHILLFGEAADRQTCQEVAQQMKGLAVDVSGQTNLGGFVSLLSELDLVICNDGGPLHLAVSQQVRTVSLFGPVDPVVYGPYPMTNPRHRVVCRMELACRPCYHQFRLPPCPYERACLTTIDAAEVIEACVALLTEAPN
jgi:lipopolysaccharide heptosyltransferase II